eukprot:595251_1
MAEANSKERQLYLEENVKLLKQLPNDLIRLSNSYQELNRNFEENLKMADNSFKAFENQSKIQHSDILMNEIKNAKWTSKDELCLKNLQQMRKYEEEMMMFQEEKTVLLQQNIQTLESYMSKIRKDLSEFQKVLQPNQIKLPFPKKKM